MADKTSFTPDEWKLLLESVMMAGMAVTAAEPSGLWGLLKESFASGSALAKVKLDSGGNPLIKAVVADFDTSEGRSTARDGLKAKLAGANASEIKSRCIRRLASGLDAARCQGAGRCRGLQSLAQTDQPGRRGSGIRRRLVQRRPGERCREGDAD